MVLHMPVGYTELFARSLGGVAGGGEPRRARATRCARGWRSWPGRVPPVVRPPATTGRWSAARASGRSTPPHRPRGGRAVPVGRRRVRGAVAARREARHGGDGTPGAAWVKAQGGRVFTESEATCVVYGMPRSVPRPRLSDRAVPLIEWPKPSSGRYDGAHPGRGRLALVPADLPPASWRAPATRSSTPRTGWPPGAVRRRPPGPRPTRRDDGRDGRAGGASTACGSWTRRPWW
jgi:hypothetical protein